MLEMTLKAQTPNELVDKINALAKHFNVDFSQMPLPITAKTVVDGVTDPTTTEIQSEVKEEKKTTKKEQSKTKKESKELEVKVPVKVAREDVIAAFKKVQETTNMETARSVLESFKNAAGEPCKRISEIQESDYAMAVKACDEATAV